MTIKLTVMHSFSSGVSKVRHLAVLLLVPMAGGSAEERTQGIRSEKEENPVHVHDLHATLLHQLGLDYERLTYKSQAAISGSRMCMGMW